MNGDAQARVLWVTPNLSARFGGPTSTVINGLIAEHRAGLDVELATTVDPDESGDRSPADGLRAAGVKVREFDRTGLTDRGEAWGLSPRLAWWLIRNLRKYDVIHLQYVWCLTSIVGALAGRLAGVPVVMTPHESLTDFDVEVASRHPLLKLTKRLLRPVMFRNVDQLIFMSKLEQKDTPAGSVPAAIVSHAVLEHPVSGPAPESIPEAPGLRIAFLGRNIRKKGIHLILEAVALHPERDRRLTIAGPPAPDEYRAELAELADRLDLDDRIEWAGYVDDRAAYLSAADVLAMPSVYEGFGMVAAEAMCAGRPVIVPEESGVAELVDEFNAGFVMATPSPEALDEAFSALEADPALGGRMGQKGIEAANSRLTFEAFAAATGAIYDRLRG